MELKTFNILNAARGVIGARITPGRTITSRHYRYVDDEPVLHAFTRGGSNGFSEHSRSEDRTVVWRPTPTKRAVYLPRGKTYERHGARECARRRNRMEKLTHDRA